MKWMLALILALLPMTALAAAPTTACCGSFNNAGAWGGANQFSFCVVGASCKDASHTQVSVSYFDGEPNCPVGSHDCLVNAHIECCGWDCSSAPECSSYSPAVSCCTGYCGPSTGSAITCGGETEGRGCCLDEEIRVPSAMMGAPPEWLVSYGDQVSDAPDAGTPVAAAAVTSSPPVSNTDSGCAVAGGAGDWPGIILLAALAGIRRARRR
jgi:MYXO-CTERM domain-containing protein